MNKIKSNNEINNELLIMKDIGNKYKIPNEVLENIIKLHYDNNKGFIIDINILINKLKEIYGNIYNDYKKNFNKCSICEEILNSYLIREFNYENTQTLENGKKSKIYNSSNINYCSNCFNK